MSVIKKVVATAAAMMLTAGAFSPVASAQEEPVVETVSPAPEVADTTTTLPPGTVKVVPETTSPSKAAEPSAAPKPEPAAPAPVADPAKPVAGPAAEGARECTPAVKVEDGQTLRSWSKVNIAFAGCGMEAGEVATATFPENSALAFQEGVYDIFLKGTGQRVGTIEATASKAVFRFTESVSHWQANVYTSVKQVEVGSLDITTNFNGVSKTHRVGDRVLDCGPDCQPPREAGAHEKWAAFENSRGQIAYQLWLVSNESSVTFSDKITDGNSEFICDSLKPAAFENKGRKSNKAQIGQKLDSVKADVQCTATEWTVTFSNVPANTWLQVDGWARPLNKGLVDEARGLHYYGDQGTIAGKPWNAKAYVFGGGGTAWQALPPAPKTTPPAPSSTPSTPAKPSSSKPAPAPSSSKTTTPSSTPKPSTTTEPTPGSSSGGKGGKGSSSDGSSSSNYFGSATGSSSRLITAALSSGNSWLLSCFPFLFGWGSATGSAAGSAAGSSKVTPAPARPAAPVQQAPVAQAPAITPVAHQAPQPQAASRATLANTGPSGVQTALALAGLTILGGAALLIRRKRS